ncbi:MAG: DUF2147 domain-containing protein [Pseudolabrys sp.]
MNRRGAFGFSALFLVLFLALFLAPLLPAMAQVHDHEFKGQWQRGDGVAQVNVAPCGNANPLAMCMTNTAIRNSTAGEKVGDKLIVTAKAASGHTLAGTAYDPQRQRSYAIEVNVSGNSMTTRGCVVGGLLCKTVHWTRLR